MVALINLNVFIFDLRFIIYFMSMFSRGWKRADDDDDDDIMRDVLVPLTCDGDHGSRAPPLLASECVLRLAGVGAAVLGARVPHHQDVAAAATHYVATTFDTVGLVR